MVDIEEDIGGMNECQCSGFGILDNSFALKDIVVQLWRGHLNLKNDVELGPGLWPRLNMPWEINASIDAQRSRMRTARNQIL